MTGKSYQEEGIFPGNCTMNRTPLVDNLGTTFGILWETVKHLNTFWVVDRIFFCKFARFAIDNWYFLIREADRKFHGKMEKI